MFKKPQSKHKMSIKTSLLNSLYPSIFQMPDTVYLQTVSGKLY